MKAPLPIESVPFDSVEIDADDLSLNRLNKGDHTGLKKQIEQVGLLDPPVVWKTLHAGGESARSLCGSAEEEAGTGAAAQSQ